jgi:translation initiation factor 1 (eIF-1/SUI1)
VAAEMQRRGVTVVEGFDASDADFQAELVRCGVRRW